MKVKGDATVEELEEIVDDLDLDNEEDRRTLALAGLEHPMIRSVMSVENGIRVGFDGYDATVDDREIVDFFHELFDESSRYDGPSQKQSYVEYRVEE